MREKKFHFITGLPRSGSTLLAALLKQNPGFHASMTSGLAALITANRKIMSAGSEVSLLMDEGQRPVILQALFDAYYEGIKDKEIIFDTNRQWTTMMPLIRSLFPQARAIACVRDVSWIMDSLERLYRKNPFEDTRLFGNDVSRSTVYSRVDMLAQANQLVGGPWAGLKEAYYGEQSDALLIVEYDLLAQAPDKVLPLVYQFLGEPWFDGHDYENVEFDAPEFDQALGVSGLHKVKPRVAFEPRRTILPPDLFKKFQDMDFWKDRTGTLANVITAQPKVNPPRLADSQDIS